MTVREKEVSARVRRFEACCAGESISAEVASFVQAGGDGKSVERRDLLRRLRTFVDGERQGIQARHRDGVGGQEIARDLADLADTVVGGLFDIAAGVHRGPSAGEEGSYALVALGGYGRAELNPASDVDLMFLYTEEMGPAMQALIHFILPLLWDLGFTVGHSVRSLEDCARIAASDLQSQTAMIEGRLVRGARGIFDRLDARLAEGLVGDRGHAFARSKLKEREARYAKYGPSVYLQEPNVKEAVGGLRDVHTALWVARTRYRVRQLADLLTWGLLDRQEFQELQQAVDYLLRLRNELHYLSGRKNDFLLFHFQEQVAANLGFREDAVASAVERCMQRYYLHARDLSRLTEVVFTRCGAMERASYRTDRRQRVRDLGDGFSEIGREIQVVPRNHHLFQDDPVRLLKVFWYSQQMGFPLHATTQDLIRAHLHLIDDAFRRSNRALSFFLALLRESAGVAATLRQMHELGVLGAYIPEFAKVTCLVQYDLYHKYTVDVHTFLAMENLETLDQVETYYAEEFRAIFHELKHPHLLRLGLLFHDIGKGEGKGHVERGTEIARRILTRMEMGDGDIDLVCFLVAEHLTMAHISQRLDLDDEAVIIDFARKAKDTERLKMLYLLSYADIRAVGPEVWTEWKGALLWELYIRAHTLLTRGIPEGVDEITRATEMGRQAVEELKDRFAPAVVRDHLDQLPPRYVLTTSPGKIAEHLTLVGRVRAGEEAAVHSADYPLVGHSEVTVLAYGRPGRFAQIVGALTANRMNILRAQVFTRKDGLVIRTFQVDDGTGTAIADKRVWQNFEADLRRILLGEIDARALIVRRHRELLSRPIRRGGTAPPTRVEIDNFVSETHTVLDVRTLDRIGLLYTLSSVINTLGLDLSLAKIATDAVQVVDVFYVTEKDGSKVTDPKRQAEIKAALESAIAEGLLSQ